MTAYKHVIQYRLSDGEIVGRLRAPVSTELPPVIPGCAAVEGPDDAHENTHIVDLATGNVVEKTATQKAAAAAPKLVEVQHLIVRELATTDMTQLPDFPITPAQRAAWTTYRQALRDLSKLPGGLPDMLQNWPARPDGIDSSTHLKSRPR